MGLKAVQAGLGKEAPKWKEEWERRVGSGAWEVPRLPRAHPRLLQHTATVNLALSLSLKIHRVFI